MYGINAPINDTPQYREWVGHRWGFDLIRYLLFLTLGKVTDQIPTASNLGSGFDLGTGYVCILSDIKCPAHRGILMIKSYQ